MTLSDKAQKAMLLSLFFVPSPMGIQERRFPLDELLTASACMKKLKEDGKLNEETGVVSFEDGEIEFSTGETVLLAKLVNGVTEAGSSEAEALMALKELVK